MKNTFLEAVSHDLRTPLTSILGSALTLEQSRPARCRPSRRARPRPPDRRERAQARAAARRPARPGPSPARHRVAAAAPDRPGRARDRARSCGEREPRRAADRRRGRRRSTVPIDGAEGGADRREPGRERAAPHPAGRPHLGAGTTEQDDGVADRRRRRRGRGSRRSSARRSSSRSGRRRGRPPSTRRASGSACRSCDGSPSCTAAVPGSRSAPRRRLVVPRLPARRLTRARRDLDPPTSRWSTAPVHPAFAGCGRHRRRPDRLGRTTAASRAPQARADGRWPTAASLAPGFVDVHNHSDLSPVVLPEMPSTLRQGVTTRRRRQLRQSRRCRSPAWEECVGLAYAATADHPAAGVVGLGRLPRRDRRRAARGERRDARRARLRPPGGARARAAAAGRRRAGPDGGVRARRRRRRARSACRPASIYVPGIYAATDELVALARAAARRRRPVREPHPRRGTRPVRRGRRGARDRPRGGAAGAREPPEVRVVPRVGPRGRRSSAAIHDAPDATGDQYPYAAWNSSLASLLPPWAPVADVASIAAADGRACAHAVEAGEPGFQSSVDGVGWDRIVAQRDADAPVERDGRGRDRRGDGAGAVRGDRARCSPRRPETACIGHAMHEDDVARDPRATRGCSSRPTRRRPTRRRPAARCRCTRATTARSLARSRWPATGGCSARGGRREDDVVAGRALRAPRSGPDRRGRVRRPGAARPDEVRDTATYDAPHAFPTASIASW